MVFDNPRRLGRSGNWGQRAPEQAPGSSATGSNKLAGSGVRNASRTWMVDPLAHRPRYSRRVAYHGPRAVGIEDGAGQDIGAPTDRIIFPHHLNWNRPVGVAASEDHLAEITGTIGIDRNRYHGGCHARILAGIVRNQKRKNSC